MGTTLTLTVEEHTEINETSISSGGISTQVEPDLNALDEYDLYFTLSDGSSPQTLNFVVDYTDGANFVVIGINKQGYAHDGNTHATITFNGETVTFIGYKQQFYFTIGGSTAVYAKALSTPVAAGTYTVSITPGDWPVGTEIGVFTGYAETTTPAVLDSFIYGDNSASSEPLWAVTPGGKPSIAVGIHTKPGDPDDTVADAVLQDGETGHPYQGDDPIVADLVFGIVTEDWGSEYPRTDDRSIATGSSGVGKRRCLVLMGDNGSAAYPTDDISISEPTVESAYSDGITVTVE